MIVAWLPRDVEVGMRPTLKQCYTPELFSVFAWSSLLRPFHWSHDWWNTLLGACCATNELDGVVQSAPPMAVLNGVANGF